MPNIGFGLYSGYVGVPGSSKQLHYIAAQSQNNPATDPVIVWFNGGPGCSSMLGFLQEHGPYSLADGALNFTQNDFSWNKQATVIYIESPAGVGFSYCPGDDCKVYNDNSTADDNLQAVLGVLGKFPELQKNPLYISGESYAGIYVPMLVDRIDQYITNCTANKSCAFIPNLKGMMVGNGVTDPRYDNPSQLVEMAFWYGILETKTYEFLRQNVYCIEQDPTPAECQPYANDFANSMANINIYDAFGVCYQTPQQLGPILQTSKFSGLLRTGNEIKPFKKYYTAKELTPFLSNLKLIPPCVYAKPVLDYLGNSSVRAQLNIVAASNKWDLCNDTINNNYQRPANGSIEIYERLRNKYRMLKYSGDTDMAVPTYGTRDWIDNLNWTITKPWKQFFVNGQVGGYVEYRDGGNFTFATIHGAGHMAPQWRPEPTYQVVFNFINNKTFS